MVAICLYFQIHNPIYINNYRVYDIGNNDYYFNEEKNRDVLIRLARKCYLPMNKILLDLVEKHNKKIKFVFSISGVTIELMEKYAPEVLRGLRQLSETGCVEFLSETYYNSLSSCCSKKEFEEQIDLHKEAIRKHFNCLPKVFKDTHFMCTSDVLNFVEEIGLKGVIAHKEDSSLGFTPNNLYIANTPLRKLTLFVPNKQLSEDVSKRFSDENWEKWPLSANTYCSWINSLNKDEKIVNLFFDYETFGETHSVDSGIFGFFKEFVGEFLRDGNNIFMTPTEALNSLNKKFLEQPSIYSELDNKESLEFFSENKMQQSSIEEVFELEKRVKSIEDKTLLISWRHLTNSDHFYSMTTKFIDKAEISNKFLEKNPYDSYIHFMNVLNDLIIRVGLKEKRKLAQSEILKNPKNKGILSDIKMAVKGRIN